MQFRTRQTKIVQHLSLQKRQLMLTAPQLSSVHIVVREYGPANAPFGKRLEPQVLLLHSSNQCLLIVHVHRLFTSTVAWDTITLRKSLWMKLEEFGPLAHSFASSVLGLVGQKRTHFRSMMLARRILMFRDSSLRALSHIFQMWLYAVGIRQKI